MDFGDLSAVVKGFRYMSVILNYPPVLNPNGEYRLRGGGPSSSCRRGFGRFAFVSVTTHRCIVGCIRGSFRLPELQGYF